MRKALAIISLVILAAILYWYTGNKMEENALNKQPSEYEIIMDYDLDNKYPTTIEEVLAIYNEIMRYTYMNRTEEDLETFIAHELPKIVDQQRKLYDDELIDYNPYEVHYEKQSNEVKDFREKGIYIIDSKINFPEYMPSEDSEGREMAKVKVIYYTTVSENIYMEFGMRKTEDHWKIVGFKKIDKF